MKIFTAIACSALLATITSAAAITPSFAEERDQAIERRTARRMENMRRSLAYADTVPISSRALGGNRPGGWGGAVMSRQNGVKSVKSTFVVPSPSKPPNGSSSTKYGGTAWVGIDGYGTGSLWQTGITWTVQNGVASFEGFYEWVPGPYTTFPKLNVKAGDTVTVRVVTSSSTSGTAYITNESTGQTVHKFLNNQPALAQQTAEWIVEDFQSGAGPIPFAKYSPAVTFSKCEYKTGAGAFGMGTGSATVLQIGQDNGNAYTSCSVSQGANTVSCPRTGAFS